MGNTLKGESTTAEVREYNFIPDIHITGVKRDSTQSKEENTTTLDDPEVMKTFALGLLQNLFADETSKTRIKGDEFGGAQQKVDATLGKNPMETMRAYKELVLWMQQGLKEMRGSNGKLPTSFPKNPIKQLAYQILADQKGLDEKLKKLNNEESFSKALKDVAGRARPLFRGSNAYELLPKSTGDRKETLKTQAEISANPAHGIEGDETLYIKVFDSQGDMAEVEETVKQVAELRKQGFKVKVEIAIPYSDGSNLEGNPYPDEFYLQKIKEAVELAKKYGLEEDEFTVSIKDMGGELSAEAAARLIGKSTKYLHEKTGGKVRLGLHLHDAGLAKEAYVAAIIAAEGYPLNIDLVPGGKEGLETGFVDELSLHESLKEKGFKNGLGLNETQIEIYKKAAEINNEVMEQHKAARVELYLTDEDLRYYHIPGGGSSTFVTAVGNAGIAKDFVISPKVAVQLTAATLRAVSRLMGEPFAVTPGFQNKQTAALHMLKKMMGDKYITNEMSFEEMAKKIDEKLSDEQVEKYFVKDLPIAVADFMKGNMPGKVHPVVRKAYPLREGVSTAKLLSQLPALQGVVGELYKEGRLKPTTLQARDALRQMQHDGLLSKGEFSKVLKANDREAVIDQIIDVLIEKNVILDERDGKEDKELQNRLNEALSDPRVSKYLLQEISKSKINIIDAIEATVKESSVQWAGQVGVGSFREYIEKPWKHQPSPKGLSKEEYTRQKSKAAKGLDSSPDLAENIRKLMIDRKIEIKDAEDYTQTLLKAEYLALEQNILNYMHDKPEACAHLIEALLDPQGNSPKLKEAFGAVFNGIRKQLGDEAKAKAEKGEWFLYSEEDRLKHSLGFFANYSYSLAQGNMPTVLKESKATADTFFDTVINLKREKIREEEQQELEQGIIKVKTPGKIVRILAKPGQSIKAGEPLYELETMKMFSTCYAPHDGIVGEIKVTVNQTIEVGTLVTTVTPDKKQEVTTDKPNKLETTPTQFEWKYKLQPETLSQHQEVLGKRVSEVVKGVDNVRKTVEKLLYSPSQEKTEKQEVHKPSRADIGYNRAALTKGSFIPDPKDVFVFDNRGSCLVKHVGDWLQMGVDPKNIIVLYTDGDKDTPIIRNAKSLGIQIQEVDSYNDHEKLIRVMEQLAEKNENKRLCLVPGWGYVSEDPDFVRKMEDLGLRLLFEKDKDLYGKVSGLVQEYLREDKEYQNLLLKGMTGNEEVGKALANKLYNATREVILKNKNLAKEIEDKLNVRFVGPASGPMRQVGNKFECREIFQEVTPELNPKYFSVDTKSLTPEAIEGYLKKIVEEMGGNVMIKANLGGGGRGIIHWENDKNKSTQENMKSLGEALHKNMQDAQKLFGDSSMLIEQCATGKLKHIEAQLLITRKGGKVVGLRECSAQLDKQKMFEWSIKEGDYPPELIEKIKEAAAKLAMKLAEIGYTGLATLEMLMDPEKQKITLLEVNTRLQVEHPVTEGTTEQTTGANISLALSNALAVMDPDKTPDEILMLQGVQKEKLPNLQALPKERSMHLRIVSKYADLETGKPVPAYFRDSKWRTWIAQYIREKTGASIQFGGLNENADPMFATMHGTEKQVIEGAKLLEKVFQLSQAFDHDVNKTSLEFSLPLWEAAMKTGKIEWGLTSFLVDETLKKISKGEQVFKPSDLRTPANDNVVPWPHQVTPSVGALERVLGCGQEQKKEKKEVLGNWTGSSSNKNTVIEFV